VESKQLQDMIHETLVINSKTTHLYCTDTRGLSSIDNLMLTKGHIQAQPHLCHFAIAINPPMWTT